MDYSFYLKNNTPNKSKLESFGFCFNGSKFTYSFNLKQYDLYAVITISETAIDVKVFDKNLNDEYALFNVKNAVNSAKLEVESMLNSIISECFERINTKHEIIDFMQKTFGTVYESPWPEMPNHCTFKTNISHKWYAIIMNIKPKSIGLAGENLIDIINVKTDALTINNLIDNIRYFPAYHMNKKNWLTIILDKNTNMAKLQQLIKDSYNLVENKKS